MTQHSGFVDVEQAVASSTVFRLAERVAEMLSAAARASRAIAWARRLLRQFAGLPLDTRLRLTGVFLIAFPAVHAALVSAMPISAAPATPMPMWAVVALVGAGLAGWAPAVAAAWERRRWLRAQTKKL